jgi:hypothetical protein
MSISQTYYIDGSSLETSTGVYLNSQMSVPANDGYYSNGSISRRQLGGILLAVQTCPSCLTECGISFSAEPPPRVSLINVNVLNNVGPIIIKFSPNAIYASGILVEYDGVYYNQLSSPIYGLLAGSPSDKETYIGEDPSPCILPITPISLDLPIYKYLDGSFVNTGSTEAISILSSQVATTATPPGLCVMVIPKPNITPSELSVKIVSTCSPDSSYELSVECPNSISEFIGGQRWDSPFDPGFCGYIGAYIYYFVSVNNSPTIGLYDWVFNDANAQDFLPNGWYRIDPFSPPNDLIEVVDGIVVHVANSSSYCP